MLVTTHGRQHGDVPWPSHEAADHRARKHAVRWQVFGLAGQGATRASAY